MAEEFISSAIFYILPPVGFDEFLLQFQIHIGNAE